MGKEKKHPELKEGEVHLTNCSPGEFEDLYWTTKRKGRNAYTNDGTIMHSLVPVFVQKSEIEKKRKR